MATLATPIAMKVISADRTVRKGIVASTFQDLLQKCKEKFNTNGSIRIVTDEDGFDFFKSLSNMTQLMILNPSETWMKRAGAYCESGMSQAGNAISAGDIKTDSKPSLVDLVAKIRSKQTSLYQNAQNRPKMKYKLKMGWLVWNDTKYVQVRLKTGGGVRDLELPGEAGHMDLLQKGKELFFPDGENSVRGYFDEYQHYIGDYKQTRLPENITVVEYATKHGLTNRPRIYLMSNPKSQEDHLELPDLDFPDMLGSLMDECQPITLAITGTTSSSNSATTQTETNENLEQHEQSSTAHQWAMSCDTDIPLPLATIQAAVDLNFEQDEQSITVQQDTDIPLPLATIQAAVDLNFEQDEQSITAQQDTGAISMNETVTNLNIEQISTANIPAQDTESRPGGHRGLRFGRRRAALRCRRFIAASLQRGMPANTQEYNTRLDALGPEVIEVVDSEDEELMATFTQQITTNTSNVVPALQLPAILKEFQGKINKDDKQEIIISRKNVLESAFRALRRGFDTNCRLYVKFSGEMGLDHGGPRREFFRLVLMELCNSSLFEGSEFGKFFTHDIQKLEQNSYFLAGKITAMSILHEGPGLSFLEEHLGMLLLGMDTSLQDFNIDVLPDAELRDILKQLKMVENYDERDRFLQQHGDWLINQGYTSAWSLQVKDRQKVLEILIKQFIYYRTIAESNQFENGMNEVLSLFKLMKDNKESCLPLLCHKVTPLAKEQFMELFVNNWSDQGSNRRSKEEDTIYSWEIFLQDIQDKTTDLTFEELLVFITGADRVPPCGFCSKIQIEFYDEHNRFPFVSTCALTLSLPRGEANPDNFKQVMVRAVKESWGFGKM